MPLFLDKSAQLKIIFPISPSKHMLWLLKEPSQRDGSFKYQKQMLQLMDKKYTILDLV